MNSRFQNQPDHKQTQQVQSFHEPALRVLDQLYTRNQENLRSKGYDENNAAVSKDELSVIYARYFRVSQYTALEIINSLIRAGKVESLVGFVKPKAGGV